MADTRSSSGPALMTSASMANGTAQAGAAFGEHVAQYIAHGRRGEGHARVEGVHELQLPERFVHRRTPAQGGDVQELLNRIGSTWAVVQREEWLGKVEQHLRVLHGLPWRALVSAGLALVGCRLHCGRLSHASRQGGNLASWNTFQK
jgi:hypothetical protein